MWYSYCLIELYFESQTAQLPVCSACFCRLDAAPVVLALASRCQSHLYRGRWR